MSTEETNVHHIMTTPQSLSRLLVRRDQDGNLIPADPQIVKMALKVAMEEAQSLQDFLDHVSKSIPENIGDFDFLTQKISELKNMFDQLKTKLDNITE